MALQFIINKWKDELDSCNMVIIFFLDLKRDFETVDSDILVKKKLEHLRIGGTVDIKLLRQQETNRKS